MKTPVLTILLIVSRIVTLNVGSNRLSGPLPAELGLLSSLESLFIFDNQVSDNVV